MSGTLLYSEFSIYSDVMNPQLKKGSPQNGTTGKSLYTLERELVLPAHRHQSTLEIPTSHCPPDVELQLESSKKSSYYSVFRNEYKDSN